MADSEKINTQDTKARILVVEDIRSVRSLIAQKHAENPEASVVVRAHELSTANSYIAIADAAREADIYNVALVPFKD